MNNWRLLLLAVVVVVQPFGSFTESNLIDGRECCERSEDARLYGYRKTDERRSLDGNREDRTAHEEHRLRSDVRDERRYETYRGPMLTRSESLERNERRYSPELSGSTEHSLVGEKERRSRDTFARNREARENHNRNQDESRNILGQNERDSRESRNRDELDASRILRLSRDTHSVERESRNTISRLPIRTFRSNEERHITENRERFTLKRENVARSDIRRDSRFSASARSESRLQLDDKGERRIFNRRTEEEGTEFRRSRFSDAKINEGRAIRAQRSIEQNERNNRDFGDMRAEVRDNRESEPRNRISAVRRDSERYSTDRARKSTLVGDWMDNRIDGRRQQRDESRRFIDTLRNIDERRVDSREIKASRNVDMNTRNAERMERRSISLDRLSIVRGNRDNRLSKSSERITSNERVARIRDARDEASNERRHERNSNRLSGANTEPMQETRRTATHNDIRGASEERREREIKDSDGLRQESRIVTRRGVRESSEERRQQRAVSRLSRDRTTSAQRATRESEASRKNIRDRPEERLQNSRVSRSMSSLRVVRDNTDRESREDARASSEQRDSENNFSRDRVSMLREKREVRSNEETQEARRIVKYNVRSDLRRDLLERNMDRARMTRNESDERRHDARKLSRARSADPSRTREDTWVNGIERQQTRSQDRSMERVTRNAASPRLESRRSTRMENRKSVKDIRVIQLARNRDEVRSERVFAERRQDSRETVLESREVRMARNRDEVKGERVLAERRQDSRETVIDSRAVRMARNRDEVKGERVLAERRQDSRETVIDSRAVRMARNRDEVRGERVLAERRQDSRENVLNVLDSREVRMARNRDEVKGERVLAERRQDSRKTGKDTQAVRMARNRDEVRGERVLAERRQYSRKTGKDTREVRMARNRDEVRSKRVLAERRQDSHETGQDTRAVRMARNRDEVRSERVLAERRQDSHETGQDTRAVRMARNRDEVRSERVLAERRQDSHETGQDTRAVRMARNRDEVRSERVLTERRQDSHETGQDTRAVRMARNRDEVRSEKVLAERRQDNRDATNSRNLSEARNRDVSRSERTVRSVRGDKMAERSDSGQRDFRTLQREAYVNELNERSRDSVARSTIRQMQMNNLRTDIRGTKNNGFGRMNSEREERRESLRSVMNYQDAYVQEDEPVFSNWQMVFYTLQGIYLCGLLVQMLNENANKKTRSFNWWASAKNLIKVD